MDITVSKKWAKNDGYTQAVEVELLADGAKVKTITLNSGNRWTQTVNVPVYKAGATGQAIVYNVNETTKINGYKASVSGTAEEGFTITNTYEPEKVSISVEKVWNDADNQDGKRPTSVTIKLNGTDKTLTLQASNEWKGSFTGLPKYGTNGEEITYTISEEKVTGYTPNITSVSGGYKVTNTHAVAMSDEISGTVTWAEDESYKDITRPDSVMVTLYKQVAGGEKTAVETKEIKVNSDTQSFNFGSRPMYENGNEITYTVEQNDLAGYTETQPTSYNITNTLITKDVKVEKVWNDAFNQDNKRPTSISVQLMYKYDGIEKTALGNKTTIETPFTHTYTVPTHTKDDKAISYSIVEDQVENYNEPVYSTKKDGTLVITNTHTPETVDIELSTVWDDANNQDNIRPVDFKVNLVVNGDVENPLQTIEFKQDAKGEWPSHLIEGLDKYYDQGKKNIYSIVLESEIEGYTSETFVLVEGNLYRMDIMNIHKLDTIDIPVRKFWKDEGHENVRPKSIKVNLIGDDGSYRSMILTEDTDFEGEFRLLPKNHEGQPIEYKLVEEDVPHYRSNIVFDDGIYFVTNSYYESEKPKQDGGFIVNTSVK